MTAETQFIATSTASDSLRRKERAPMGRATRGKERHDLRKTMSWCRYARSRPDDSEKMLSVSVQGYGSRPDFDYRLSAGRQGVTT